VTGSHRHFLGFFLHLGVDFFPNWVVFNKGLATREKGENVAGKTSVCLKKRAFSSKNGCLPQKPGVCLKTLVFPRFSLLCHCWLAQVESRGRGAPAGGRRPILNAVRMCPGL